MFDFNLDDVQENINLKEGVNKGLKATKMFDLQDGEYGKQFVFEFSAGKFQIKHWLSIPNEPAASDYSDDGEFQEALTKYQEMSKWLKPEINTTLSQFLSGFYSPKDVADLKKKMNEEMKKVDSKSLEEVAKVFKSLLPKDWEQRNCELLLHYRSSSEKYVKLPKYVKYNNGRVFNAHEDRTLEISNYFKTKKMGLKGDTESTGSDNTSTEGGSDSYNW